MPDLNRCVICQGTGRIWAGTRAQSKRKHSGWVNCYDCLGTGHVRHCVACVGRGILWLGGDEYLECPACEGTGKAKTHRIYVFGGGILIPKDRRESLAVAKRSPRVELTKV